MADNTGWYLLSCIVLASGIGIPVGTGALADRHTSIAKVKYGVFLSQKDRLKSLRMEIDSESWRWPIYVRPVLFKEIDQVAQVRFSNVENALNASADLIVKIQPLPETPLIPIQRFSIPRNIKRILICMQIEEDVDRLENFLDTAENELEFLRLEHEKEGEVEQKLLSDFETLKIKVDTDLSKIKSARITDANQLRKDWVTSTIKNCIELAGEHLINKVEDGSNFAAANILIRLANYILDEFDLYNITFKIPSRFEPDHFNEKLAKLERTLEKIVNDSSLQNWRGLYRTDCHLQLVNRKFNSAKNSMENFLAILKKFLQSEEVFLANDLAAMIESSEIVQRDCTEYWMTPEEGRDIWGQAIKDHLLPSIVFGNVRRFNQANILPLTAPGMIIKQKSIPNLINNFGLMFKDIQSAKLDIQALTNLLAVHKNAHAIVLEKIKEKGETWNKINGLGPIAKDTSKEIQDECTTQTQLFEKYVQRANIKRGANYPDLLERLNEMVAKCVQIKSRHTDLIAQLQSQVGILASNLQVANTTMESLKIQRPGVDWDWKSTLGKISAAIKSYDRGSKSYSQLVTYQSVASQILDDTKKDREAILVIRMNFERKYKEVGGRLDELSSTLHGYEIYTQSTWQWARNKIAASLQPLNKRYHSLRQLWTQVLTLETMQQALRQCEDIVAETGKVFNAIRDTLEQTRKQQEIDTDNYKYFLDRSTSTGIINVPTKSGQLINKLCEYAMIVPDHRDVDLLFESANILLRQGITKEQVIHIENLIQDYSQKIETINVSGGVANVATRINQYNQPASAK